MKLTKHALTLALAVLAVSAGVYSSSSSARPSTGYTYTYYSTDNLSVQVGTKTLSCNGHVYTNGTVTPYFDYEEVDC